MFIYGQLGAIQWLCHLFFHQIRLCQRDRIVIPQWGYLANPPTEGLKLGLKLRTLAP
jgi:hypothetical protein